MSGAKWITLAQALELAPSEDELRAGGLNGHIAARITCRYRPSEALLPDYWNGEFDLERSRMRRCDSLEFDSDGNWRQGIGCWINGTVEIDLQSVRKYFGLDQQQDPPKNRGGRPPKWNWEEFWCELAAIVHDDGLPDTDTKLAERMAQWFAGKHDNHPALSEIRERIAKLRRRLAEN
jgi:hypothetical protein